MSINSSNHHYIPKFLINGFKNNDGLLYIYNKEKDEILTKPRSPKSVFFEKGRNTVHIKDDIYSSMIEDVFYQDLDILSSKVILKLQNDPIGIDLLSGDNLGTFQFFLVNLFWRLPYTDSAVNDVIERAKIMSYGGIDPEVLRKDETFKKLQRIGFFKNTLRLLGENKPSQFCYPKILDLHYDYFVIGDNPILFRYLPKIFTDLVDMDYLFAVSARRIFCNSAKQFRDFDLEMILNYNALIIDQSKKYICLGNKVMLEASVDYYKYIQKRNLFALINEMLFVN